MDDDGKENIGRKIHQGRDQRKMARGRHGQELCQALDDAEDDGLQKIHKSHLLVGDLSPFILSQSDVFFHRKRAAFPQRKPISAPARTSVG